MNHPLQVGDVVWLLRPGDDEPVRVVVDDIAPDGFCTTVASDGRVLLDWLNYIYADRTAALEAAVRRASKNAADLRAAADDAAKRLERAEARLAQAKARLAQAKDQP